MSNDGKNFHRLTSSSMHGKTCFSSTTHKLQIMHLGSGQATPKYTNMTYWLCWITVTGTIADTRKTLWPSSFSPWKQEINLQCESYPLCTRGYRDKACYFFTNLLPEAQTPLSCQFFTSLLFICLKSIKTACFGHFFRSHMTETSI